MKFLVDEQLPGLLADWLTERGHDAIHVTTLLTGNHIPDAFICARSIAEQRVVISKDDDFLKTFLVKQHPYKLIHLTTGNLKNRQLLDLFRANFDQLCQTLETASVIELNQVALKVWY